MNAVAEQEPNGGLQVVQEGVAQYRITLPPSGQWNCSLVDAQGKIQQPPTAYTREVVLDLSDKASGIYLFRCVGRNGNVQFAKSLRY